MHIYRLRAHVPLLLVLCWYFLGTLPYLHDFPLLEWAQMGIMAPAHQLAATGVYGNDLFTGFYRNEIYNYEYMPLYPLLVAMSFKVFGVGIVQARMVSVLAGAAVVLLTYLLGRQLCGRSTGLLAALVLCCARLGVGEAPYHTGIPLIDLARAVRYDVLVPVCVLAASCCFVWSCRKENYAGYLVAGLLAGAATLAHLYGAFVLAVFGLVLIWRTGWCVLRQAPIYLLTVGWILALLPWLFYIMQDVEAYQGQMLRHQGRFDLLDPAFYASNLLREVFRYTHWVGPSFWTPVLWPRLGIWLVAVSLPWMLWILWHRARRERRLSDQLLFVALPVLSLLLALLMDLKRYPYVALTLPFAAILVAAWLVRAERWAGRRVRHARAGVFLLLIFLLVESGVGIRHSWHQARAATPYQFIASVLQEAIPSHARVLISQPYWLALANYETRSINLAFMLSDPRFRPQPVPSMEQVLWDIAPDYIVVEEYFLIDSPEHPAARLSWARKQWRMFGHFVDAYCPHMITEIPTPDYGNIKIFRCL